jgi:hypothetical protein
LLVFQDREEREEVREKSREEKKKDEAGEVGVARGHRRLILPAQGLVFSFLSHIAFFSLLLHEERDFS